VEFLMKDLCSLLREDYQSMLMLLDTLVRTGINSAAKRDLAEMLDKIFTINMKFKEETLYPAVRRATANGLATPAIENHEDLKKVVAAVKDGPHDSAEWEILLIELQEALENSVLADERLLDVLQPMLPPAQVESMGQTYLHMKAT
jgi:DNA-binding PadR family transcriptional regulator